MYETGILVAFLMWVWGVIYALILINSQFERNLNKVGLRLSWFDFKPKPISTSDRNRGVLGSIFRFTMIYGLALPLIVVSWLYVAIFIGSFIYRKSKDAGAPQDVKEFRWKMRNMNMPMDDVLKGLLLSGGQSLDNFDEIKAATIAQMSES